MPPPKDLCDSIYVVRLRTNIQFVAVPAVGSSVVLRVAAEMAMQVGSEAHLKMGLSSHRAPF